MNFWNPFIRIASRVASKGNRPTGPFSSPTYHQRTAILKNIGTGAQLNKLKRQEKAIAALKDGQRRNLLTRAAPLRIKTKYAVRDAERRIRGPVVGRDEFEPIYKVRKHDSKLGGAGVGAMVTGTVTYGATSPDSIVRQKRPPSRRTPTRPQKPRRGRRR